ncbi:MAG: DedA family protein [Cryobacterium sp.]|nr:DedA family protein [Micrococcales bacterium]MBX3077704.1 DedA family protein [Cryobacterium sp.]
MLHNATSNLGDEMGGILAAAGPIIFYVIVWALVFAGTAIFLGLFIPFITGDSLLFASGLIAASATSLNIVILAVGVGISAFLGDQVGFLLGRHYGRGYLDRHGGRRTQKAIHAAEVFYLRYGWWSIVVARFVPWGRVFVPVIAGVGRMNYYRFLSSNLVGALAWGVGLTLTGYYAAFIPGVKSVAYVIAGVVIAASIVAGIHTWRVTRHERRAADGV